MITYDDKTEQVYISKYNNKCENQIILLMITYDDINWQYLKVKKITCITQRNNIKI